MGANPTASGGLMQPLSVPDLQYRSRMANYDIKKVLWSNVQKRMVSLWEKENLTRLCNESSVGPGTATRIKEQSTSVGIDVLEKIAEPLGVAPWQLINPNMEDAKPMPNDIKALQKIYNRVPIDKRSEAVSAAMFKMLEFVPDDSSQPTPAPNQADAEERPPAARPNAQAKSKTP